MAITPDRVTASSPAVVLAENDRDPGDAEMRSTRHELKNVTASGPIYLGDEGVDDTTGFIWLATDGIYTVELEPGEALYGYADTPQDVHVLSGGR